MTKALTTGGLITKHRRDGEIVYGKTKIGQLLYDLAFTDLDENYLARKHKKPVAKIRELRSKREIKGLRQKNGLKNRPWL